MLVEFKHHQTKLAVFAISSWRVLDASVYVARKADIPDLPFDVKDTTCLVGLLSKENRDKSHLHTLFKAFALSEGYWFTFFPSGFPPGTPGAPEPEPPQAPRVGDVIHYVGMGFWNLHRFGPMPSEPKPKPPVHATDPTREPGEVKLPKQWKHWCSSAHLRPRDPDRDKRGYDAAWLYLHGHGREWRVNRYGDLECGDTYADFDRWARCRIHSAPMPKTRTEFIATVTALIAAQQAHIDQAKRLATEAA